MLTVEEARIKFKDLATYKRGTGKLPEDQHVWSFRDEEVDFRAVKFAEPEEAAIGDYTGIEVSVIGRFRKRRTVVKDLIKAWGKPSEKLRGVFKNSQVIVWKDPRLA